MYAPAWSHDARPCLFLQVIVDRYGAALGVGWRKCDTCGYSRGLLAAYPHFRRCFQRHLENHQKKHRFLDAFWAPFWVHLASKLAPFWDYFLLQCFGIFPMRFFLIFSSFSTPQTFNVRSLARPPSAVSSFG